MSIDPSATIHASAVIEDGAIIGADCKIGPFCMVGAEVSLGAGVELISHVAIAGQTSVGDGTRVWPFASLGHQPQDLKFKGERTTLEIGSNNMIREHVTMNPGTEGGGGVTRIGNGGLFMMGIHIGHDCIVGNGVVMANHTSLGGHCEIGDGVVIGGLSGVHQFCRIGQGAMIGGMSGVVADVIPYGIVMGERAHLAGLNLVGLRRRGADKAQINGLRAVFDDLFTGDGNLQDRAAQVGDTHADNGLIADVTQFITSDTSRRILTPAKDD